MSVRHAFHEFVFSIAIAVAAASAAAQTPGPAQAQGGRPPGDDPYADPAIARTLDALKHTSTWWHPDLFGMSVGLRRYAHRQFHSALHYFEIGARYADKLSQLSLGLMYLNGEGTPKDPVTGYAWLEIAAERGYPDFVATRDNFKKTLTEDQLAKAEVVRATLAQTYGDAVAKPRMAWNLRQGLMDFTGSRTGFNSGISQVGVEHCGPALVIGGRAVPQVGCGEEYLAKSNWDPDLYFARRDREWMPNVDVGAPIILHDKKDSSDASPESATKQP